VNNGFRVIFSAGAIVSLFCALSGVELQPENNRFVPTRIAIKNSLMFMINIPYINKKSAVKFYVSLGTMPGKMISFGCNQYDGCSCTVFYHA
jgi:hypothetical protein